MTSSLRLSLLALAGLIAAAPAHADDLTVYSGRGEAFMAPILKVFEEQTGIKTKARYGTTAELAALLREEGAKSPADVFIAQDAGALGATADLMEPLPAGLFEGQMAAYRGGNDSWIGTSGRARTLVYSSERVAADKLPQSVYDLVKPEWKGKVGFAPKNASFQAFVTAMRVKDGEDKARAFVKGLVDNGARTYANNVSQVQAVADGEVDVALVNSYYLTRFKLRDAKFPVSQTFFAKGDIGNLLFVSGAGVLKASDDKSDATKLVEFMLSPVAQQYFSASVGEYPVIKGVIANDTLGPVAKPEDFAPDVKLEALNDTEGTKKLLTELNLL
ncbi:ABC transporter substrate-binding protein [Rhizobium rhizosphaerae]|uniref:ABC transporter substrate-binding protein n=1 Tax=Xaviernesmea rhizosphaerae TaxID=1672749 RepID=A0A1Q9ADY6_9HYPH|nr:iron ABC transporter substrate-binding protein [Xaviernesmea rhizosphaerae]OLP53109.1 ABC transporter substrate-binding protein [Xaviernesmea rhizosphaerae]